MRKLVLMCAVWLCGCEQAERTEGWWPPTEPYQAPASEVVDDEGSVMTTRLTSRTPRAETTTRARP